MIIVGWDYCGVAADEAKMTLEGSMNAMKASFKNVLGNLALGEDVGPSLTSLGTTFTNFFSANHYTLIYDSPYHAFCKHVI